MARTGFLSLLAGAYFVTIVAADNLVGTLAPEWQLEHWINSNPLELAGLRGKVVLIRWWTAPGTIILASNPADPRGVILYYMYRSDSAGGDAELVGSTTLNEFTDLLVQPGADYFYSLVAKDQFGVSSTQSAFVNTILPPPASGPALRRKHHSFVACLLGWFYPARDPRPESTRGTMACSECDSGSGEWFEPSHLAAGPQSRFYWLIKP